MALLDCHVLCGLPLFGLAIDVCSMAHQQADCAVMAAESSPMQGRSARLVRSIDVSFGL
eukprot:CAMPEP_0184482360 /NCGR_PEP_ID=MMETSP0113_2-20130426/3923_1 /TAXON_ID=91329 /ORGANISM="Norrisiella sphaerica, Strain BC52" /LENGTH=58 /DNA_ID=CAMNT_0026862039 /DNA_START=107 /DNA_END=279 /DNA_ORIENTATION=-